MCNDKTQPLQREVKKPRVEGIKLAEAVHFVEGFRVKAINGKLFSWLAV